MVVRERGEEVGQSGVVYGYSVLHLGWRGGLVPSVEMVEMCSKKTQLGRACKRVLPAWSYPGKVQEREAKLDGTFHLWKWVQDQGTSLVLGKIPEVGRFP